MNNKNYFHEIAKILGVKPLEEFNVVPTKFAKFLGYEIDNLTYRFDYELSSKGYDDGYSEWYGGNYKRRTIRRTSEL